MKIASNLLNNGGLQRGPPLACRGRPLVADLARPRFDAAECVERGKEFCRTVCDRRIPPAIFAVAADDFPDAVVVGTGRLDRIDDAERKAWW